MNTWDSGLCPSLPKVKFTPFCFLGKHLQGRYCICFLYFVEGLTQGSSLHFSSMLAIFLCLFLGVVHINCKNYGCFLLCSAYCQMIASYVLCWICGSVLSWKYNSNWYDSRGHIIYNLNHVSIKSKLGGWYHHTLSVLTFNPVEDLGQNLFTKRKLINNKQSRKRRHMAGNTSIDLCSPTKRA